MYIRFGLEYIMKKWSKPVVEELSLKDTANQYWAGSTDELSSVEYEEDLGTCHNPYWQGNGLTQEQAHSNNPYWNGGWGQN